MRKMICALICSIALLPLLTGCGGKSGGPSVSVEQTAKPKSSDELKSRLQGIAQSGEAGSAAAGLRPAIEEMKSGNPQVATELLSELSKLEASTTPAEAKAIATRMVAKL